MEILVFSSTADVTDATLVAHVVHFEFRNWADSCCRPHPGLIDRWGDHRVEVVGAVVLLLEGLIG